MKFIKRISLFEAALVLVILSIHLYAALSDAYNFPNAWFKRDDAYYYFKVAQNITAGLGSTFDGINLTNGYHPLWMLICIPIFSLAKYDLILPLRILLMVMAVFQAASAVLIYRLVRDHLSNAVAILAASFWAFNFYIHSTVYEYGLETPVAVFTLLWLISRLAKFEKERLTHAVTTRQLVEIGLIAVLVMLSRLDLIFLTILVGVWVVFRNGPQRYLLPVDVVIIFAAMTSSAALRTGLAPYNAHYASAAVEAAIFAIVIKIVALYFFGAYQPLHTAPLWKTLRQVFFALTTSTLILAAYLLLRGKFSDEFNFPRSALLLDWGINLIAAFALRLAAYWFSNPKPTNSISAFSELQLNWKTWLAEGTAYYGVLGGFLAVYMVFNKFMFGTTSPVSGQIKRWWGTMPYTTYEEPPTNWFSFFGIGRSTFNIWDPATDLFGWLANILRPLLPGAHMIQERYYFSMLLFIIAGLILAFTNKRRTIHIGSKLAFIPILAGSGIQILSYTATAYGGAKEWYWVSELVLIILAGSFFIDLLLRPLQKLKFASLAMQAAALLLGVFMANNFFNFVEYAMPHNYFDPARRPMDVLNYLEENTPPGSVIGMTGGGNVGYFINDRTIINMDGLINSYDYFRALQGGEGPAYLREHGLTIIFANAKMLSLPPFYDQFGPYLQRFNEYGGKALFYLLEEPKY